MSVFYATIADTTLMTKMNNATIDRVLTMLTSKWDCDSGIS
jgi:hypothetical protein